MEEKESKKEKLLKFCISNKKTIGFFTIVSILGIELIRKRSEVSSLKGELYIEKGINKNLEYSLKGLRKEVSDLSYHLGKLSKGRR